MGKDELVDVVTENGETIGQEMKSVCHEKGIFHRFSGILLFNEEGKLWLQTRSPEKNGKNLLDFSASGHVAHGETSEETAYREMKEEIGVNTQLKLIKKNLVENIDWENRKIRHIFNLYQGESEGPFKLQEEELSNIELFELEQVKKLIESNPRRITKGLEIGLTEYFKQEEND